MPDGDLALGLIGNPLGHSLSPHLHAALLRAAGLHGTYRKYEIRESELRQTIEQFRNSSMVGINVTIPYKRQIMGYLDDVTDEVKLAGAVNTVKIDDGRMSGYNTDVFGFGRALQQNEVTTVGASVALIGAGGAARAVCCALANSGVIEIRIHNRNVDRACELRRNFARECAPTRFAAGPLDIHEVRRSLATATIIINATSVGMWPNTREAPVSLPDDMSGRVAVDLVYNPVKTRFLEQAERLGARIVDGLDMFIWQGVQAMQIWLGHPVNFSHSQLRSELIEQLPND